MDRSSPYYVIGIIIVSMITFLFLFFVLPRLDPLIGIFILTGMLILMVISFLIRTRRMRTMAQKPEIQEQVTNTEQYIKQIDEMMRKE